MLTNYARPQLGLGQGQPSQESAGHGQTWVVMIRASKHLGNKNPVRSDNALAEARLWLCRSQVNGRLGLFEVFQIRIRQGVGPGVAGGAGVRGFIDQSKADASAGSLPPGALGRGLWRASGA